VSVTNRKTVYFVIGIIGIAGLGLLWLTLRHRSASTKESQVVHTLLQARERRSLLNPNQPPVISNDFMIVQQHATERNLAQPMSDQPPDATLIDHDCGTLTVTITADRIITLNTESLGTLNDTAPLASKLSALFQERIAQRAYLPGFESRSDLPIMDRIPRTVLLRPSRSLGYGDVLQLIELLKEAHADPIGLQITNLPT
jgi:biopolymer transport protein ExbD